MNKLTKTIAVTSLLAVLTGCTSKVPTFQCTQDNELAPKWTCNPPIIKDKLTALGVAPQNTGNDYSFQRSEALADARDSLASQINTKVQSLFKSYKSTTGSGTDSTFDKANSKVSKQLTNESLKGSRSIKQWKSSKGTLFVLVSINKSSLNNNIEKSIKTSFKNDQAMYQRFLADKANGELGKEVER